MSKLLGLRYQAHIEVIQNKKQNIKLHSTVISGCI